MSPTTQPNVVSPSDAELLAQFALRRQEAAFAELVRRHGGMVLSVCRSRLDNTPDAEDAAQAVFLTLARKASSASVQARLVGWLHRVAWYVASRAAEARAIRRRHEREAARMKPELWTPDGNSVPLADLHAALNDLSESDRVPLILFHLEGRSHKEMASLLGCSVEAVAVRLHRGRERLRKRLVKSGVPVSAAVLAAVWVSSAEAAVPEAFVSAVAGNALAAGAVSIQATALSQAALSMLFWAKLKTAAMVFLAVGMIGSISTVVLTATYNRSPPEAPSAAGTITWIQPGRVTIHTDDGDVAVAVDEKTTVSHEDKPAAITKLRIGMTAEAFAEPGQPAKSLRAAGKAPVVLAKAPPTGFLTGTIDELEDGAVALVRRGGEVLTIPLDVATVFRLDKKPVARKDLRVGMRAVAFLRDDKPAQELWAYSDPPE